MPGCAKLVVVVVFLSKKLYSLCSSLSSCLMVAWCHPGKQPYFVFHWGSNCPTVLVSLSGIVVVAELQVLQPLSVRPRQSSCGLLVLLQEDLSAHTRLKCLNGDRNPIAGLLGGNSCVSHSFRRLTLLCFGIANKFYIQVYKFCCSLIAIYTYEGPYSIDDA